MSPFRKFRIFLSDSFRDLTGTVPTPPNVGPISDVSDIRAVENSLSDNLTKSHTFADYSLVKELNNNTFLVRAENGDLSVINSAGEEMSKSDPFKTVSQVQAEEDEKKRINYIYASTQASISDDLQKIAIENALLNAAHTPQKSSHSSAPYRGPRTEKKDHSRRGCRYDDRPLRDR